MIVMMIARFVVIIIISYLLGSIPSGALISKRFARVDIRQYGSGRTGTTNVLRVAGRKAAILVFSCDMLKGALAVALAGLIIGNRYLIVGNFGFGLLTAQVLAALAAMAGHNWSIFLKFQGGRGVATFFGGLAALSPVVALFGGEVFVVGVGVTRFVSLGSMAGAVGTYAVLVPLAILDGFPIEYLVYTLIGTVVIIVMHRDNISRLISGKERKLGEQAEKIDSPPSGKPAG